MRKMIWLLLVLALLAVALSCAGGSSGSTARNAVNDDDASVDDDDDDDDDDLSPDDDDASPADDDDDLTPVDIFDDDTSPADDDDTFPQCRPPLATPSTFVPIDRDDTGRYFDGLGAISSAGNSRYLIDYPEPQRSQILDYLFKPNYGAALHILKVEVGGDANSTSGADASHQHTAGDLNCDRSYQWWLIAEAKKRNPNILLYALAWGAPAWVRGPNYWSSETLDYLLAWIECGRTHKFMIDYLGGRNESTWWSRQWYINLKAALAARHYPTKVVAADSAQTYGWIFPEILADDPGFAAAVDIVGVHYPCVGDGPHCSYSDAAIGLGKPLWASECSGDEGGWSRIMNRSYIDAKVTALINWPMVAAAAEGAALSDRGVMTANQPWSGAYTISPELWVWAHLTQFVQPGWRYLDSACGYPQNDANQGSYTTLISPNGADLTIIIETTLATQSQVIEFDFAADAPQRTLRLWASNISSSDNNDYLNHLCDVTPVHGAVQLTLQPNYLYTLSTTFGQAKGDAAGPSPAPFPLPYENDFADETLGREAHWVTTQMGAFETQPCTGRSGNCLRQTAAGVPITWGGPIMYDTPFTIVGDGSLSDYELTVDALLEAEGSVRLLGRYGNQVFDWLSLNTGYEFTLGSDGAWTITRDETSAPPVVLAAGTAAAWPVGTWRTLSLTLQGSQITAAANGEPVASVADTNYASGEAGFGIGGGAGVAFIPAQFGNLKIAAP